MGEGGQISQMIKSELAVSGVQTIPIYILEYSRHSRDIGTVGKYGKLLFVLFSVLGL